MGKAIEKLQEDRVNIFFVDESCGEVTYVPGLKEEIKRVQREIKRLREVVNDYRKLVKFYEQRPESDRN